MSFPITLVYRSIPPLLLPYKDGRCFNTNTRIQGIRW